MEFTQRAFYLTGRETIPVPGSVIMGLHIKHGQAENREEVSVAKEASGPKAGSWDWEGPQREDITMGAVDFPAHDSFKQ